MAWGDEKNQSNYIKVKYGTQLLRVWSGVSFLKESKMKYIMCLKNVQIFVLIIRLVEIYPKHSSRFSITNYTNTLNKKWEIYHHGKFKE